jgi:SOS-response transcriptional repressor LexA
MTNRQRDVYRLIRDHWDDHGYSPTQRELCDGLGIKSFVALRKHLRALQKEGWITCIPGQARGIIIEKELVEKTQLTLFEMWEVGEIRAGDACLACEVPELVEFSDFFQLGNMLWQVTDDASEPQGMQRGDYLVWKPGKKIGVLRLIS